MLSHCRAPHPTRFARRPLRPGRFGTTTPSANPSLRELRDLPHPCHPRSLRSRPRRLLRRALACFAGRGEFFVHSQVLDFVQHSTRSVLW
jgi:hypothetical protein